MDIGKSLQQATDSPGKIAVGVATGGISTVIDAASGGSLGNQINSAVAGANPINAGKGDAATQKASQQAAVNATDAANKSLINDAAGHLGDTAAQTAAAAATEKAKVDKASTDTGTALNSATTKLNADADTANGIITQAKGIADAYKDISTNYQDIASRYKDAVTGLSDNEKATYEGAASQNYAAMSAVSAQGNASAFKNNNLTTGQQAAFMASGEMAASSAYASAIQNMQSLDTQRRQLQEQMVTDSSNTQLQGAAGKAQASASAVSGELTALGQSASDTTQAANAAVIGGNFAVSAAQNDFGADMTTIGAASNAAQYADTADIAENNAVLSETFGVDSAANAVQQQGFSNTLGVESTLLGGLVGGVKAAASGGLLSNPTPASSPNVWQEAPAGGAYTPVTGPPTPGPGQ